jgi:hypothetical protein
MSWDWPLTLQTIGTLAAASAAGAAWRSAILSGRAIKAAQRERVDRAVDRLERLRAELESALSELLEEGRDRASLKFNSDRALRVRLTELVWSEDHLPNVRAFQDRNHTSGAKNLRAAIADVEAELRRIDQ